MRTLLTILCFLLLSCSKGQTGIRQTGILGTLRTTAPTAAVEAMLVNDHDYSAFPWPDTWNNQTIAGYKKSLTHAYAGPFMLLKSSNGGQTVTKSQITLNGAPLECSNLGLKVFDGRILINHQPNVNTGLSFAYSDDGGTTWTDAGTVLYPTGYDGAPFGKMVKMPSGKIYQPYYVVPRTEPNPWKTILAQSTDGGQTWTEGPTIASQSGGGWPNASRTSEVYVVVTHEGATDSDTKLVAILRNEDYEGFSLYASADGGQTWTWRNNYLLNVLFPNPVDRYPVHVVKYGGTMYLFAGIRVAGDMYVGYVTCTPDDLYNNVAAGYSSVVRVKNLNATTLASSHDAGYPEWFVDPVGNLCVMFYDASPDYTVPNDPYDLEMIYQVPVITN